MCSRYGVNSIPEFEFELRIFELEFKKIEFELRNFEFVVSYKKHLSKNLNTIFAMLTPTCGVTNIPEP